MNKTVPARFRKAPWWWPFGKAEAGSHTWAPPLYGVQAEPPCNTETMRVEVEETGHVVGVFCCSLPDLHRTRHESYDSDGVLLAWHELTRAERARLG